MKIKVSGVKERRATQLVRELYEQGITVERIYGMYFEWDAINSHKASEEERGRLTVADASRPSWLRKARYSNGILKSTDARDYRFGITHPRHQVWGHDS